MGKWIATGVSGTGRVELLDDLAHHCRIERGDSVVVHDVGAIFSREAKKLGIPVVDNRILNVDHALLRAIRRTALAFVRKEVDDSTNVNLHLIGVHATFRWRGRLIPGIAYQDVLDLNPDGFINIVDDLFNIYRANEINPKWDVHTIPDLEETQEWMIEEEFITELLAEMAAKPSFLVSRQHDVRNLANLFFLTRPAVYFSFPITSIKGNNPELLTRIQNDILRRLQEMFLVYNPLDIQDMELVNPRNEKRLELESRGVMCTPKTEALVKARTIQRDFKFIRQAHGIVVYYPTEKISPGVMAEIFYAHRHQKPIFMYFPFSPSPFLEDTAVLAREEETFFSLLEDYRERAITGTT